jgi:acetyltransferase EpsM
MHIIGASGHAKVIIDVLLELGQQINGIWDENPEVISCLGYSISGNFNAFKEVNPSQVIIAIGNNSIRKMLASQLTDNTAMVIHPKSTISRFAKIGFGTVIMANATINAGASIGKYAIINTNSSVDHDCFIDDFVHISPKAGLGGGVKVGEGTHIGLGASVIHGISIGKWATIGAGAVIVKDVPDYAVVVGNPGRIIKYNKNLEA